MLLASGTSTCGLFACDQFPDEIHPFAVVPADSQIAIGSKLSEGGLAKTKGSLKRLHG